MTGLLYFPSGAILCETSTQSFKILSCTQYNSIQLEIRERSISDQLYSIKWFFATIINSNDAWKLAISATTNVRN